MLGAWIEDAEYVSGEHGDKGEGEAFGGNDLSDLETDTNAAENKSEACEIEPEFFEREEDHGSVKVEEGWKEVE